MRRTTRTRGSAITETGPALLLFFMFVFFPVLDLLYMGCGFGFAWFLHSTELRELSVNKPSDADTVLAKADADFFNNAAGMAKFLQLTNASVLGHDKTFTPDPANADEVTLTTRMKIRPWLYIPIIPNVPGLSADIPLVITSTKPQEEKGRDG